MEVRTRKSTVASYLVGVFSLFFGIACVAGEPHGGLGFGLLREFALYGGKEVWYGWLFGGWLLCVIRADMVNG